MLAEDANPEDDAALIFAISGEVPSGYEVAIAGQTFTASADASVPTGSSVEIPVTVSDGKAPAVDGLVVVTARASTRPLPACVDDVIDDARPDAMVSSDVTANDFNPFPETPLRIVDYSVESGDAQVTEGPQGLEVTPGTGFFGTVAVRYTVEDATGSTDRQADGHLYVTVAAAPDAPQKPLVTTIEDGAVTLEWPAPPSNGARIEYYTVASDLGTSDRCDASICHITGLKNDVEYRFRVTAHNRVGDSSPSPYSDSVRPDARPDQPDPPSLTFGDGSLAVEWTTPTSPGSAVTSYELEISPPPPSPGSATRSNLSSTSFVWTGLQNGVAYQVRVRASNKSPEPSTWSDYSASEVPAGPPAAPVKPTTTLVDSVGSTAQMRVDWSAPSNNGDPISSYLVEVLRGGAVVGTSTLSAGANSTTVDVTTSETAYTFRVSATNKAGTGAASPESDSRRAVAAPGAPTAISLSTPLPDKNIVIGFTQGPLNGIKASEASYEYRLSGDPSWHDLVGSTISGGSVGQAYTAELRAKATVDDIDYFGAVGSSINSAIPYGAPNALTTTATPGAFKATFDWTDPVPNGRSIDAIDYSWDGVTWTPAGTLSASSVSTSIGFGKSQSFWVRVTDSTGQQAVSAEVSGKPIGPYIELAKGGIDYNQCSDHCYYFDIQFHYFPPSVPLTFYCYHSKDGVVTKFTENTFTPNSSGYLHTTNRCFTFPASYPSPYYVKTPAQGKITSTITSNAANWGP